MVVFGAPKHVRSSYRLWEEPKVPDFVLEVASESTYRSDRGEKRDIYADMGVMEYWQCDPTGGYLDPPLLGFRLVEGRYAPVPVTATEGGVLAGCSEVLGLELRLTPGAPIWDVLRFYDPTLGGASAESSGRGVGARKKLSGVVTKRPRPVRKLKPVCVRLRAGSGNWRPNFGRCSSVGVKARSSLGIVT